MSGIDDTLHIASHVPGRLRVRAQKLRDEGAVEAVVARLRAEPGVRSVSASELTGSVLVHYDPAQIQLDHLLPVVLEAADLDRVADDTVEPKAGTPGGRLRAVLHRLDARACEASTGRIDIRTGVPAAFLCAGVLRLARGGVIFPKWYELAFWSFVTFVNLNPREHPAERHAP